MTGADVWEVPDNATIAWIAADIERDRRAKERAERVHHDPAKANKALSAERGRQNRIANLRQQGAS